jgi:protein transport protein SEC24
MLETVDMDCTLNLMAKQGVEIAQKVGFDQGRARIHATAVDVLRAAQGRMGPGGLGAGGLQQMSQPGFPGRSMHSQSERPIPDSLKLLPLYAMALQKSLALRGGQDVRVDERAYYHALVQNMDVEDSKVFVYPRMFSIHDMSDDSGLPIENNELLNDPSIQFAGPDHIKLPNIMNLSHDRLDPNGIILLDNGHDLFMWIGRSVDPVLLANIFGVSTLDNVNLMQLDIQAESCDFAYRLQTVINALRSKRYRYMPLAILREGDGYADAFFSRYLVEDKYVKRF